MWDVDMVVVVVCGFLERKSKWRVGQYEGVEGQGDVGVKCKGKALWVLLFEFDIWCWVKFTVHAHGLWFWFTVLAQGCGAW